MTTIGIIKDVEYEQPNNKVKNIDVAIFAPETNIIEIITISSFELAACGMGEFPFEPFGAVEYSKESNKVRPLVISTEEQKRIYNKMFFEILKDPQTEALWGECYNGMLELLDPPGQKRQR